MLSICGGIFFSFIFWPPPFFFGPNSLGNVSFALEENVSSAVVGWSFYKCHQIKSFENAVQVSYKFNNFPNNFPATLIVDLSIFPFSSTCF